MASWMLARSAGRMNGVRADRTQTACDPGFTSVRARKTNALPTATMSTREAIPSRIGDISRAGAGIGAAAIFGPGLLTSSISCRLISS